MDFWRQLDIVKPDKLAQLHVTLIGLGGIGSSTAICLAKMGVQQFVLYDPDTVEAHNVTSTMYRTGDVGAPKVSAASDLMHSMADGLDIVAHKSILNHEVDGLVISGVDSMTSRKQIWDMVANADLYIDARMSAQVGRVITIQPRITRDREWYEKECLFDDNEGDSIPCTNRAIIYNTFMIASLICETVKRYAMDEQIRQDQWFDFVTKTLLA